MPKTGKNGLDRLYGTGTGTGTVRSRSRVRMQHVRERCPWAAMSVTGYFIEMNSLFQEESPFRDY